MNDLSIKQLLQTMSLDGIEDVVQIIRDREDIASIILLTEKDLQAMATENEQHMRGLVTQIRKDVADDIA